MKKVETKILGSPNVHERIGQLIDYYSHGNKTAFGRETGILPGVLASITGGRLSKPSFELLEKIMGRFPAVSGDWLVMGRGSMLKPEALAEGVPPRFKKRNGKVEVSPMDVASDILMSETIPIVPYEKRLRLLELAINELVKASSREVAEKIKSLRLAVEL